ncbi:MAG TPA: histidine phosphatase family protein [Pseudolabrys sp.]
MSIGAVLPGVRRHPARTQEPGEIAKKREKDIMRKLGPLIGLVALICLMPSRATAADVFKIVPMLKQGGYVLVLRHGATDESQKDVYPFVFDDMTKQRQLSDQGRTVARDIGAAFEAMGISISQVYSSKLNRAIETGSLISSAPITPVKELTDSGAGSAAAMANPNGGNTKTGSAILALVNRTPAPGANTLLVTHKTNIADAFGKEFADVKEAETLIYRPNPAGPPTLIARVQASEWIAQAKSQKS